MDIIRKLALEKICPLTMEPTSGYEKGAVENLVLFGSKIKQALLENMEVFFVGQYKEDENRFEIQGVFSTELGARWACRDRTYFVLPLVLDQLHPHETVISEEAYYPLEEND